LASREQFRATTNGTALELLHSDEALGDAQLNGLKKIIAAFDPLYGGLSSDGQKKIADAILREGESGRLGPPHTDGYSSDELNGGGTNGMSTIIAFCARARSYALYGSRMRPRSPFGDTGDRGSYFILFLGPRAAK
jgi:hypothetical protein